MTTAIRVFAIALASGIVLSDERAGESGPLLAALAVIAGGSAVLDWTRATSRAAWIPMAEMLLAALTLASAADVSPGLFAYLAGPPVVAGVRHGPVTTINTTLLGGLGLLAATASLSVDPRPELIAAAPWALTGLGFGLVASWQSRSIRVMDSRLAPYEAAHELMERLHRLTHRGAVGLDTPQLAAELESQLRNLTGAARSSVFTHAGQGGLTLLSSSGDHKLLQEQVSLPAADRLAGVVVIPLQRADDLLGVVVLYPVLRWDDGLRERTRVIADQFALQLDTALLFDAVRHSATSEERTRIAREMHDGVAQEIVALGYVVDEIEATSKDPHSAALASTLRDEMTRVVTELRYSIFDLRHKIADRGLSGALTEYVHKVNSDTDTQIHMNLNETDPALALRVESELLRIAQEAIGNVRRHAHADNLWVTYVSDGPVVRLQIDDDGVGNARARDRHWGLQTMHERAQAIGADLVIADRDGGGTSVCLITRPATPPEGTSP